MRHFVVCERNDRDGDPYVLAEVVGVFGEDMATSLAGALAGAQTRILTRAELVSTPEGARALGRWQERDDDVFDDETALLAHTARRTGRTFLRTVPSVDVVARSPEPRDD